MPHLIIKFPRKPDTLFEIDQMETVIGRGDECDLVLSNLSVSRQHAKLIYEDLICKIVDLGSDNGIIRKQEKVEEAILESRDEVIIGNFTLIYLGNAPEDQFYRQRSIRYMPKYEADKAKPSQQDTFQLSPQEAQKMVKERNRLNNGCIEDSLGRIYYLESKTVTFGKKPAQIPIEGWFISGVIAKITWQAKHHQIEKLSMMKSLLVNGKSVKKHALEHGDKIEIAGAKFFYKIEE